MSYKEHAKYWEWDAYDRSGEFEFWCALAKNYGSKVLSAMGATGQAGAYMAQKGFDVTVLDYTKEMISEGKKKYASIKNLCFAQGDIRDYSAKKPFDFVFIASADLHHLTSIGEINKALRCLNKALRSNGGLALKLWLPGDESFESAQRVFEAHKAAFTDRRVYKKGYTRFDAVSKKVEIRQTVYVEFMDGKKEDFRHNVDLQLYEKEELLTAFYNNGFMLEKQFGGIDFSPYREGESDWFVLLSKK